jgi:hypothetical protein
VIALKRRRQSVPKAFRQPGLTLAAFKDILDQDPSPRVRAIASEEVIRMQGAKEPFSGMRRYFAAQWGLPGPA